MEEYGFYAMLDRMQYINRWALMRNSRYENIKEHSFDVAVIAQALCLLHNKFNEGKEGAIFPDPYKVMAYALYHDCTEIIDSLTDLLPEETGFKEEYRDLLAPSKDDDESKLIHTLVKAADKIAAYIKCLREESSGNKEFSAAKESIGKIIEGYDLEEVRYFMERFVPPYGYTLDRLTGKGD